MSQLTINLRALRETRGLSQEQLASAAQVRQGTISDMETGKTRRVDLDIVERIAAALNVHPCELLAWEPKKRGRRG